MNFLCFYYKDCILSIVWYGLFLLFQVQVKALQFAQLTEQSLIGNDELSTWLHKELRKVQYMYLVSVLKTVINLIHLAGF